MTNNPHTEGVPFKIQEGDQFIPSNTNAVVFHCDKGICICDFDYVKWLVANATPEQQYQAWEDSRK